MFCITNIMNSKTGLSKNYYKFPNGLLVQWGQYVAPVPKGNLTVNITFPVAYSTIFYISQAVRNDIDTDGSDSYLHYFINSLTGFSVGADNYRNDYKGFYWLAVGY